MAGAFRPETFGRGLRRASRPFDDLNPGENPWGVCKDVASLSPSCQKGYTSVAFFYEIRSPDNTVLKRAGGFPNREAAKMAAREDAKRMKAVSKPPTVGRILVRQSADRLTRP